MSSFICEPPRTNEKSEVFRMLKLWDVNNGLVNACVDHISADETLQAEIQEMKSVQVGPNARTFRLLVIDYDSQLKRGFSATRAQDFLQTIDVLNLMVRAHAPCYLPQLTST